LVEAFTFSSRIHRWPDLQKPASICPIEWVRECRATIGAGNRLGSPPGL